MKKVIKVVSVFLGLVYLLSPTPALAAGTVKIGLIYSLSGPGAPVGKLQAQGAELAISEINAAGGVDLGGEKAKLEAVVKDDQTKPPTSVQAMQSLAKEQGVTAVLGGTFAHTGMALNNEAKQTKVFFMATCGVPDLFFKKEAKAPDALCIAAGVEDMCRPTIRYTLENLKAKRVALFVPAYAVGQAVVAGFEAEIKKHPGVKHEIFWHPVGSSDMRRDLTKVAEFKPDALYIGSWGGDAIKAFDEVNKMRLNKDVPVIYWWLLDAYAVNVPPDALKGLNAGMYWYHDMNGFNDPAVVKASDEFAANYLKVYKIPPDPYAMMAYYGVKETARALELAKSTDPDKMYSALMANPEWEGAKGPAKWRKDGRPQYKYFAWIVKGKGSEERQSGKYDKSFDFAQILDVVSGENLLPKLEDLGY